MQTLCLWKPHFCKPCNVEGYVFWTHIFILALQTFALASLNVECFALVYGIRVCVCYNVSLLKLSISECIDSFAASSVCK